MIHHLFLLFYFPTKQILIDTKLIDIINGLAKAFSPITLSVHMIQYISFNVWWHCEWIHHRVLLLWWDINRSCTI